jgi:integrase
MALIKTKFPGIRYRQHPDRKHGVQFDKYFFIRHRVGGKEIEEAVGWSSQGITAQMAADLLSELRFNKKTGNGPRTLKEKRGLAETERQAELDRQKTKQEAAAIEKKEAMPLDELFNTHYLPYARNNKKPRSVDTEAHLFKNWISPIIGKKPLKDISVFDCERLKKRVRDGGKSDRTLEYTLAVLRQVFNVARKLKLYAGVNPLLEVEKPKFDNQKQRFLTREETELLMTALKNRNLQLYRMAMISLHAGLRAGEVFGLTWGDVDLDRGLLLLRDTKNTETRYAFMTATLRAELEIMTPGQLGDLVFTDKAGGRIRSITATWDRVITDLGFNKGIADRRLRFTFHGLRHSFASNLVSMGADLYKVQLLLGHKTQKMTIRYSHMRPDDLRAAVNQLDGFMKKPEAGQVVSIEKAENE